MNLKTALTIAGNYGSNVTIKEAIKTLEPIVRPTPNEWKTGTTGDALQVLYEVDHFERLKNFGFVVCGVTYDEELAGPHGMNFLLYREAHTTKAEIDAAKRKLRQDRDVVHISVTEAPGL